MATSDANKKIMLQHEKFLNHIVAGLLLDDDNPRRGQDDADALQEDAHLQRVWEHDESHAAVLAASHIDAAVARLRASVCALLSCATSACDASS